MARFSYDQPSDDNFAAWHQPLWSDVQNTCGSEPGFAGVHSLTLGGDVFSNMMDQRAAQSAKLTDALAGDSSLGSYIGSGLVGAIVFVAVAIVLFVLSIFAAAALAKNVRECIARCCCGSCRSRSRIRLKAVKPHNRSFLFIANLLGLFLVVTGLVLVILTSVQTIAGTTRATCGVWLGLYGHFFGVTNIAWQRETAEIAWQWNGSHNIMNQLRALDERLEPGINNPVYTELLAIYADLQKEANATAATSRANVESLIATTQAWDTTWNEWISLKDSDVPSTRTTAETARKRWRMLASEASVMKGEVYLSELDETMDEGWVEMERLLDLYSGPDSRLMYKASNAVKDTFSTIADVDAVVASLTRMWADLGGTLRSLLLSLISLNIIVLSVGFITAVMMMYLTVDLLSRLKRDLFPPKPLRRLWASAYGIFAVLAGCAVVLSSLAFITATVGSDACPLLTTTVFEEGRWDLLGQSILNPREPMNVDMDVVFNTCLRTDGSGDVASALGLDGQIAELADDTDIALADIRATRDRLLNRDDKTIRAQVLVVAYNDLLELQAKGKPKYAGLSGSVPIFFNETEFIRFDADDYETIGLRSVLCVVPHLSQTIMDVAYDCLSQGVQLNIAPHNRAMDVLTDMINYAHAAASEPIDGVPKVFCSQHAIRQDHPCAEADDPYMLTNAVYSDTSDWIKSLNAALPGTSTQGDSLFKFGDKVAELIHQLADINDLTSFTVDQLSEDNSHLECPNDEDSCRIDEARQVALQSVYDRAGQIVPLTLDLFALFDEYVDKDVTETMDSLVADANAVTEGSNCQFEGTAFRLGGVEPLCQNTMPGFLVFAILLAVESVAFMLFAVHSWKWYHYMEDLAMECLDDEKQYEAQKAPAAMTSAISDMVAIYNQSPRLVQPVISNLRAQEEQTLIAMQELPVPVDNASTGTPPGSHRSTLSATILSPSPQPPTETPRPALATDAVHHGDMVPSGTRFASEASAMLMPSQGATSFDSDQMIPISAATRYRG